MSGCKKSSTSPADSQSGGESAGAIGNAIPVVPETGRPVLETLYSDTAATRSIVTLRWTDHSPPSRRPVVLSFCLPADQIPVLRLVSASLNGESIEIVPGAPAVGSASLGQWVGRPEFMGWLRHWPVYRLSLDNQIWKPLVEIGGGQPVDYQFTLEASWSQTIGPASTQIAQPQSAGFGSWQRIMEALVVNESALQVFMNPHPPGNDRTVSGLTDPRPSAPGARLWGRLAMESEGLVRLDPDDLLSLGFTPAETDVEALRIFSHGRSVPVMIGGRGALRGWPNGIYFRARKSGSDYSGVRVYWVTSDRNAPSQSIEAHSANWDLSQFKPLTHVRRRHVLDHDAQLQVRHGDFLAIEDFAWVDAPLEHDTPLQRALELPAFYDAQTARDRSVESRVQAELSGEASEDIVLPASNPIEVELDIFFDRPLTLNRKSIEVGVNRNPAAKVDFYGMNDSTKRFSIPADLFAKDTPATLSLTLTDVRAHNTEATSSGLWFDRMVLTYDAEPIPVDGRLIVNAAAGVSPRHWIPLDPALAAQSHQWVALQVTEDGELIGMLPWIERDGQTGVAWIARPGERLEILHQSMAMESPAPSSAKFGDEFDSSATVDLLIVAHQSLLSQADRLAEFRRGQGMAVQVVDVQAIYDRFNHGELSPESIRAYLQWLLKEKGLRAPASVVLFGDCTSDYRNLSRYDVKNLVPSYTHKYGSERWASDYWMTLTAGTDDLGDFMLGRISVNGPEDARTVVDKLIAYDTQIEPGPWEGRLGYVSDDGEFPAVLQSLRREETPPAYLDRIISLQDMPLEDNWYLDRDYVSQKRLKVSRATTQAIYELFREGVSYLTYYGHGSPNIWSDERIWFGGDSANSDNLYLANSGHMTFIANMTCNSGAIDYPQPPWNVCITEDLLRVPNGGAIGCYVPSGPGSTLTHKEMSRELRRALFDDRVRALGELVQIAKTRYMMHGEAHDLLYMYHLLGDPVTQLRLTQRRGWVDLGAAMTPGSSRPLNFTGVQPAAGRWSASLVDMKDRVVWAGEGEHKRGMIRSMALDLPGTVTEGPHRFRMAVWNEDGEDHQVIAGDLAIQRPVFHVEGALLDGATSAPQAVLAVHNPQSEGLSVRLETQWNRIGETGSETLEVRTLSLEGESTASLQIALPELAGNEPIRVTAHIIGPDVDRNRPTRWSWHFVRPEAATAQAPVIDLERSYFKTGLAGVVSLVCAGRNPERIPLRLEIRGPQDQLLSEYSIPMLEDFSFVLKLTEPEIKARNLGGALVVTRLEGGVTVPLPGSGNRIPLDRIPARQSRLTIQEAGITITPQSPSQGQTIFFDIPVVNEGDLPNAPAELGLLDALPASGGRMLENRMGTTYQPLEAIPPGQQRTVRLRWDPVDNAGTQTVVVHLRSDSPEQHLRQAGPVAQLRIAVRSPSDLRIGNLRTVDDREAFRQGRVTLRAEIVNRGQTPSEEIVVRFFRSRVQIEENQLGEVELPSIPGESSAVAEFVWNFQPGRDFAVGLALPEPTVLVWPKGSRQRVSSVD